MNNNQSFDEWSKSLETMDFDHYSLAIKEKIMQSDMDKRSKKCFSDCFDYISNLYKNNKHLDVKLLKIHLEEVKGYDNIKFDEFVKILILLNYCGFNISYKK